MAPEVLTRGYDEKCDVWSLGVIMYNMLSEKPLFYGLDDKSIVHKLKNGDIDIDFGNKLSKEALDLMKNML